MDWGRKWLVDLNAGKTQPVLFDPSNNTGAIDVEMDRSVLEKKHLSRCWDWLSLLNLTETFTLSPLIKLSLKKLEPWFVLCFFLLRLLKTVSKKIGALICSMFLSPEIAKNCLLKNWSLDLFYVSFSWDCYVSLYINLLYSLAWILLSCLG